MSTNRKNMVIPRKFSKRRGVARIDVAVNKELIEQWLDAQYSAESIYNALIESGKIERSYSYRTFLRALYSIIPKSKRSFHRPSKTRAPENAPTQQEYSEKGKDESGGTKVVKASGFNFVIPTNSITGDDE
ncbi:MAG: hypothetical protein AB7D37_15160 [Desulfovibrio sp.]